MQLSAIRKLAGREQIDYQFLLSALSSYARPRDKISQWIQSGELIRVKKGLYVFSEATALHPYPSELILTMQKLISYHLSTTSKPLHYGQPHGF